MWYTNVVLFNPGLGIIHSRDMDTIFVHIITNLFINPLETRALDWKIISLKLPGNSEADASELLENIYEMFENY